MPDRKLLLRIVHRVRPRVQEARHSTAPLEKVDEMSNRLGPVLGIRRVPWSTLPLIAYLEYQEKRGRRDRSIERERERESVFTYLDRCEEEANTRANRNSQLVTVRNQLAPMPLFHVLFLLRLSRILVYPFLPPLIANLFELGSFRITLQYFGR